MNLSIMERGVWNNLKDVGRVVLGVRGETRLQVVVLVLVVLVVVVALVVLVLVVGGRGQTGLLGDPGLPRRIHT